MAQPERIERPKQLLVEGNDEINFFEALIKYLSLSEIQIREFEGKGKLRSFLSGFVSMSGFDSVTSLGVVRDADGSAQAAFQSVQGSLRNANLPAPPRAGIRQSGTPDVSVLILPDESSPGMLETLLCRTFKGSEVDRCIDDFFVCAKASPNKPDKARAFAFLTTTPNPHHSVGVAAKQGVWDFDDDVFERVREFLKAL